ncbi:hypothetical protein BJ508DRAFT_322007 [Ascobolus immersus RN42]|uniref:Uncharacterized protein n=1 Tax=Ascobolus immersus RN42 TaxID=1160509 RepID=A0A3N4ILQ9_ASCIM|nr:hypothetical protein BJ508DRAFT_322007 [Ascobolus immersus RN42]
MAMKRSTYTIIPNPEKQTNVAAMLRRQGISLEDYRSVLDEAIKKGPSEKFSRWPKEPGAEVREVAVSGTVHATTIVQGKELRDMPHLTVRITFSIPKQEDATIVCHIYVPENGKNPQKMPLPAECKEVIRVVESKYYINNRQATRDEIKKGYAAYNDKMKAATGEEQWSTIVPNLFQRSRKKR